jgi:hypothetical protein
MKRSILIVGLGVLSLILFLVAASKKTPLRPKSRGLDRRRQLNRRLWSSQAWQKDLSRNRLSTMNYKTGCPLNYYDFQERFS